MPERYRLILAISFSLLLHFVFVLLLFPTQSGLASFGTTGLGQIDGSGMTVTLVEIAELAPPTASEAQPLSKADAAAPQGTTDVAALDPAEDANVVDKTTPLAKPIEEKEAQKAKAESITSSGMLAEAKSGATGQNGQTDTDLWTAIAPCWHKLSGQNTLSATLTISFDSAGAISVPPVIERSPDAGITMHTLKAESVALQALAECGAYPMAKDLQNVTVMFPSSGRDVVPVQVMPSTSLAIRP